MNINNLKNADVIKDAINKAQKDSVRPLLVIRCITYNHGPYLAECLDGIVMQKTTFPFVALVHDDASLDGTADILKEYATKYPNIIKPILDHTNRYRDKSLSFIMNEWVNAYGPKYIATCEGDDFWIDPLKLQTQVDFLESNDDFNVCSHRIFKYDSDDNLYWRDRLFSLFKNRKGITFTNRSTIWLSETSSIVFRSRALSQYVKYKGEPRDNVQMYFLLRKSKGFCLSHRMSVYRQHSGGVFSKQTAKNRFVNGSYKTMKELYRHQKNFDTLFLYYRSYANTFITTKGKILFMEKFDIIKFLSLLIFIPTIIIGIHPIYKLVDKKPW